VKEESLTSGDGSVNILGRVCEAWTESDRAVLISKRDRALQRQRLITHHK